MTDNTMTSVIVNDADVGRYSSKRTTRELFCFECGALIPCGQIGRSYTGNLEADEPREIVLCTLCVRDWRILTRIERQHTRPFFVQFGTLRDRVTAAHAQGLLLFNEGTLLSRWVLPKQKTTGPAVPAVFDVSKDYNRVETGLLIVEFESDMTYDDPNGYDRQRFRRSLAQKELCRRPGALQEVIIHLRRRPPKSTPFIRTGWGNFLCFLQTRVDPENDATPDDYDAIDGWLSWAEHFLESRQPKRS